MVANLEVDKVADMQGGHRVVIIDHWSIINHFAQMVDILDFLVDVVSKWSIFHQNLSEWR